jgi:hypothetical protein
MPNLIEPVEQEKKKTGTDDQTVFDTRLANTLSTQGVLTKNNMERFGLKNRENHYPRRDSNPKPLAPEANALSD